MTPKLIKSNFKKSIKKSKKKSIKRKIKKTKLKGGIPTFFNNYMPKKMKPMNKIDIIRNVRCYTTNEKGCIACKICGTISGTSHEFITHHEWCSKYNTDYKPEYYTKEYIENKTQDWTEDRKRFVPFVGKYFLEKNLYRNNFSNNNFNVNV